MPYPSFSLTHPYINLSDVGDRANPTFADIDGDGDLDAFVGESSGNTIFFKNTGTTITPIFAAATNPFGLSDVGHFASPSLVDIDGDSDLDVLIGNGNGNILFFMNIGTASNPVLATPATNPFGLSNVGYSASPTFVDIDNDNDLDAFVGNNLGNTLFFRNMGTTSSPIFGVAITNPFGLTDVGFAANPALVDIDGDEDLDIFIGNGDGNALYLKNTGTIASPIFSSAIINPFGMNNMDNKSLLTFADIDGDGDLDNFMGQDDGTTLFSINKGTSSKPEFTAANTTPFGLSDVGYDADPTLVDIDNDDDLDAFVSNREGNTLFFRNTGTTSNPLFAAAEINPFGLSDNEPLTHSTFVDIDGDGDLDGFMGSYGNTHFFRNMGTASNPLFAAAEINPFGLSNVEWSTHPTFVDIDGDGDLDAFLGSGYGNTHFFRNMGTITSPFFAAPIIDPFGLTNVGYAANPNFVDIDGDGDLDAFVSTLHGGDPYSGGRGGDTVFFENTGTANSPVFSAPEIYTFGLSVVGMSISPTFVDIDDDGDLDAFVGKSDGHTQFLVNNAGLLLVSTTGNDILTGMSSNDNDTVTYNSATESVTVNLNITTQQNTIGAGLDTLISIENLNGSSFNDNLTGNSMNNILRGGDGNDTLRGWSGADTMLGGFGDDSYFVENTGDVIIEYEYTSRGIDSVNSNVTYTLPANVENLVLTGALTINGVGNNGNNNITGNAANNFLSGEWGNDTLNGGVGADTLAGGFGNDNYVVDNVGDVIIENPPYFYYGMDNVNSSVNYTLPENVENLILTGALVINGTGNGASNNITGNGAINILNGAAGNDILDGGAGADTLIGGLGSDNYVVDNTNDVITENLSEGFDKVNSNVTYRLPVNVENLTLTGALAINGTGNNQINSIIGNTASNRLNGGAANDTLDGGTGDDTLSGESGADTMIGGLGDDTYFVENAGDVVTEKTNEGTDNVSSKLTYTLSANVENLTLTGTAAINGTGNGLANVIIGSNAANQLNGGAGNDTLEGGLGANKLTGGTGNDVFKFNSKGHIDTITDYNVINDTIQLENAVFTALTATGTLAASQFKVGTKALDANDFIIYNKATGALLYDADGNGAIAATQIATIGIELSLTNADIVVI